MEAERWTVEREGDARVLRCPGWATMRWHRGTASACMAAERWDQLVAQIEESNRQPEAEALPTMTGHEIAVAVAAGRTVEGMTASFGWSPAFGAWFHGYVTERCGWRFVARVVEPPPPVTEWVPLHQLRGRKLPGCDWAIGDWCTRGTPSDKTPGYRVYREFATNDWEDVRLDDEGRVEVLAGGDEQR